ncbi:hypothetical protein [Ancylobacter sp.]|uniref:hypothetical protein n=1 Tax=Ancylobacter sp. TaxID=1872567 RepID=UPI003D0ED25A
MTENTPDAAEAARQAVFANAEARTRLGVDHTSAFTIALWGARAMQAAMPAPVGVRVPDGWKLSVTETDGRVWLNIVAPSGASASLSCAAGSDNGPTIAAQVLRWMRDDLSAIEDAGAREGATCGTCGKIIRPCPTLGTMCGCSPTAITFTPTPAGAGDLVERTRRATDDLRLLRCPTAAADVDEAASRIEALEAEIVEYRRAIIEGDPDPILKKGNFLEMIRSLHSAQKGGLARATTAEADLAALTERNAEHEARFAAESSRADHYKAELARLRVIVERFYQANDDGKLCDCIDNTGAHYPSQFLADTLDMAAAALSPAKAGG